MEANQIRRIFKAMSDNGFSSLELEIGKNNRVRLQLEAETQGEDTLAETTAEIRSNKVEIPHTQMEIRSDKVGSFSFEERLLKSGDKINKGEVLGNIKGISFQDKIKCSLSGVIHSVEVESGSIVDYGRLLFVVDID